MSSAMPERNYFEAALTGSAGSMSKDTMARKALDIIDRADRVLRLHSVSKESYTADVQLCKDCETKFPCPTVRALTGV